MVLLHRWQPQDGCNKMCRQIGGMANKEGINACQDDIKLFDE